MKDVLITTVVEDLQLTPAEQELAAAVMRGDVFGPPEEEQLDAEILSEIAADKEAIQAEQIVEPRKDEGVIPRPRFNEVIEENKALKAQLEQLKTPATPVPAEQTPAEPVMSSRDKIREMRRQQENLRIEGDLDAAALLGDQIDDLILQTATATAESTYQQKNTQAGVQTSMEAVATAAFAKYPFLDVNSDKADSDAVTAVINRRNELISEGELPAAALQAAIDEKGPKFAKLLGVDTATTPTAEQIKAMREKEALERASAASLSQPAILPNRGGKGTLEVNVNNLTPAEIKAMPEEQKARMRGDVV